MKKTTGILLVLCLLAGFMSVPTSAAFSIEPAIAAGGNHSVALASNGTVWIWGDNNYGQLGDGTQRRRTIPVQVSGLCQVISIAAGSSHTVALKSDGTVWACGQNAHGQLGDGTTTARTSPVQVPELAGVIAISAHDNHNLALCEDGTVWAWGDNGRGQLGNGTLVSHSPVPVQVQNLDDVTAIAAGWGHSLALCEDGTVWAWGNLNLGDPPTNLPPTPEDLLPRKIDIDNVTAIAAGGKNAAAIRNDGTVWTWRNDNKTPAQVQELSGVSKMAVGVNYFLVLKNDGTLWAWGDNKFGQLGNGTNDNSDVPMQLIDFIGVTAIAAHDHSLALKSDGVVWAWGCNTQGQLGHGNAGTETSATAPGAVQSPFKRGLFRDNVLNLYDTHPWWRSMCGSLQFVFRYLFFGWLWM